MNHERWMRQAIDVAADARHRSSPNPWVGCVLVATSRSVFEGATEPPGQRHAEIVALDAAGEHARGSTIYTTLEPCSHHGRTGPCTEALIAAGVARVIVGVVDPDVRVGGRGIKQLRAAGIEVIDGVAGDEVTEQLRPYLHHRSTGRPFVVVKLAATLDGRTAAPDGTSQWITGPAARTRVHQLRADSDAIVVGAGTVRADNPSLTVRHVVGPDPRRIVLGSAPAGAAVHPCLEWQGPLPELLDRLGSDGVLQLMVEGGAHVAASFHRAGLVDRYVIHLAPALFGGADARPLFAGAGASTIADIWRGRIVAMQQVGADIELVLEPERTPTT